MKTNATHETSKRRFMLYQWFLPAAVVLAILVLLAFVAWEAMWPDKRRVDLYSARIEVRLIAEAVKEYQKTVGSYPPGLRALLVAPADLPPESWAGPSLPIATGTGRWTLGAIHTSTHGPEGIMPTVSTFGLFPPTARKLVTGILMRRRNRHQPSDHSHPWEV